MGIHDMDEFVQSSKKKQEINPPKGVSDYESDEFDSDDALRFPYPLKSLVVTINDLDKNYRFPPPKNSREEQERLEKERKEKEKKEKARQQREKIKREMISGANKSK